MKRYKNIDELFKKNPGIYKYYTGLPYEVQQMLDESKPDICSESEFKDCIINFMGNDIR